MSSHLYQLRVIEEKRELDERITRLVAFLLSDAIKSESVSVPEVARLALQLVFMRLYSKALGARIGAFKP